MKFLLYSDLHLRPERMEDCEIVLKKVGDLAVALQDKLKDQVIVINGGDTFNTRGLIKTSCFDTLYSHYRSWSQRGLTQWILVGNHDQEDKAGLIHPMRVFSEFKGWVVADKPMVVGDVALFPYLPKSGLQDVIKNMKAKMAVVHWGINGAMMNEGHADSEGVPLEWLKSYKQVFSGHYHYRNALGNVQYIGSPMQQSFNEINQKKGVLYYDNAKKEIEFKEIKGTSCHYEVEVQKNESKKGYEEIFKGGDHADITERDFLRIRVSGDTEFCSSVNKQDFETRYKCNNVKVERDVKDRHISRLKISALDILSTEGIMEKYVDFVDVALDKKKLMEVGRSML